MPRGSVNIIEGQGVHREVKSEGLAEKYQAVTENVNMLGYRIDEVDHLHLAAQAHLGPTSMEEIKIISPMKLREVQPGQVTGKEPYYHLPGLEVIEKGTCSSCKGALLVAMRRLSRERRSPSCTILMGQRVREREDEFAPNLKPAKPLVGIGRVVVG